MDIARVTALLEANAGRIASLIDGVGDEQARWRPAVDAWSMLEVANHLWDEEVGDFPAILGVLLERPNDPFPEVNPGKWVVERRYNERELAPSLAGFLDARRASLVWLGGLRNPRWQAPFEANNTTLGAADICAAWVAHDLLHLRQLVELQWAWTTRVTLANRDVAYAGGW